MNSAEAGWMRASTSATWTNGVPRSSPASPAGASTRPPSSAAGVPAGSPDCPAGTGPSTAVRIAPIAIRRIGKRNRGAIMSIPREPGDREPPVDPHPVSHGNA